MNKLHVHETNFGLRILVDSDVAGQRENKLLNVKSAKSNHKGSPMPSLLRS
ncbi:hypothetical protein GCM10022423_29840 [Flavobacterium ginsengiterrae]|uniref:Uncharacterized protein n=1 Tax=Flavobacterium ginsengiterrae TaxID=871695 RepID=A0ABP7GU21_9FLAO